MLDQLNVQSPSNMIENEVRIESPTEVGVIQIQCFQAIGNCNKQELYWEEMIFDDVGKIGGSI